MVTEYSLLFLGPPPINLLSWIIQAPQRTLTAWRHSHRCTSFSLHLEIFIFFSLSVTFWTSFIYKNRIVAKTIYGH